MKKKQQSAIWTIVGLAVTAGVWYYKQHYVDKPVEQKPAIVRNASGDNTVSTSEETKQAKGNNLTQAVVAKPGPNAGKKTQRTTSNRDTKIVTPTLIKPRSGINSKADEMLRIARVTGSGGFKVLKGSRLVERKYGNDGDSFLVKHNQGETDFRLYFVDTSESWYKASARGSEKQLKRLQDQGNYFGGLTIKQTMNHGILAKEFVKALLKKKPFTVVTKWENVYGPDRKYAFIIVEWKGEKRYLHEILVSKGLARIHTIGKSLPDSTSSSRQKSHLRAMEKHAKAAKIGGWKHQ